MSSSDAPVATEAEIDEAYRENRARIKGLCVGHCNRKFIDSGAGSPSYGDPVLCHRCISGLRDCLDEIDRLAAIASATADGHRGSTGSDDSAIRMHRGGSASKSPSPVFEDLDEMASCLYRWMRLKRPAAARLGLLAREITETAYWLKFNLPSFTDDREHAADFQAEITGWHSRLIRRGKAGVALFNKPLPCPRCRLIGLQQERGSEVVKCAECGRIMTVLEYDEMAAEADAQASAGSQADTPRAKSPRSAA
jgi:hypothetical protein